MKVLVTGATGFIGNHLILEMLERGEKVIATSTDVEKANRFKWFSEVEYIEYTINDKSNEINLYEYFGKPDKLIHLAWTGLPNYTNLFHVEKNLWNDYFFLKNFVVNGLRDLTVTGTCFEYGLQEGCLNEDTISNPSNSYAIAKDTLRKFLFELNKNHAFDLKWIRLFYMYGNGQNDTSIISQLEKAIEGGESLFNMSGGDQERDYLSVSEVVKRINKIAMQNQITGIVNCCSGEPIKLTEFVRKYLTENNKDIELNLGYYPYSTIEPMSFWGDITKYSKIK